MDTQALLLTHTFTAGTEESCQRKETGEGQAGVAWLQGLLLIKAGT